MNFWIRKIMFFYETEGVVKHDRWTTNTHRILVGYVGHCSLVLVYAWQILQWLFYGGIHYHKNLNCGGQKALIEAVFAIASVERLWLTVALTEAIALPASVNWIKHSKKKNTMDKPMSPSTHCYHCSPDQGTQSPHLSTGHRIQTPTHRIWAPAWQGCYFSP